MRVARGQVWRGLAGLALALLGMVTGALASEPARQESKTIRIGVLAWRGTEDAEKTWSPTITELGRALPDYRFEMVAGSAAFLTAAVAGQQLHFLITNPGHFLELEVEYSAKALATEQTMDGTSSGEAVAAAVIAPAGNPEIRQLIDFKGHRIAAVSREAFGYRAARREFLERGLDLGVDVDLLFVGFPAEGVLAAIRNGRADGGIVRSCLIEKLVAEGLLKADEFKVIGRRPSGTQACQVSTRLYPGWPFVKVAQTSPEISAAVSRVLLSMQPTGGEVVWTSPEDYASVQDLYRTLKVGPYAPFSQLGMLDFAWQHRYWGIIAGMGALWWIFHAARVTYLLRKRTAELKRAHELSRIKSEQMEHTLRLSLMGEMASSLAHEINQPLAAILSYARGCERRLSNGSDLEGVRAGVERIAVQAERAGSIVRRMRDFVRKNPSRQTLVDPVSVLTDALALFEPTARGHRVRIETDIPTDLPTIRADRLQIEEVLLNLLQNALEAVPKAGDGRIWVRVRILDHQIKVSVTDNGPGVAPGAVPLVFEAFFTTKPDGLGLGLSLSRTIVEAHGGRLDVDVQVPGETTFWFVVPMVEENASA